MPKNPELDTPECVAQESLRKLSENPTQTFKPNTHQTTLRTDGLQNFSTQTKRTESRPTEKLSLAL
jgi:hypothetical protein